MRTMEKFLRLMADNKFLVVYLSAQAPALFKTNAQALPINSCQVGHRILRYYSIEVSSSMPGGWGAARKAIVSRRFLRALACSRAPAAEAMLNTKLLSERIEKSDFSGAKKSMGSSKTTGSQNEVLDMGTLITENTMNRKEGLTH